MFLVLSSSFCLAAQSWSDWRGPNGDGHAPQECSPPVLWDGSSGRNVAWRVPVWGRGHSSPIVVDGEVWLTTASADGRRQGVVVVDVASGAVLLDEVLFENADPDPLGNDLNNYAAPSCVAEPGRVFVHFGSYGTACYQTRTHQIVWRRRDLSCKHWRGPGSSPVLWQDFLILSFDGADRQYIAGLNKHTGEQVWIAERSTPWNDIGPDGEPIGGGDFRKAFSTPLIVEDKSGSVLVCNASKCWFGYDPASGAELWRRFHAVGHSGSSRPVHRDGVAFLNTGFGKAQLHALRIRGARGEVGDGAVLWTRLKNVPNRSSPILVGEKIFMVDDGGILSCVRLHDGETLWRERLAGSYSASPVVAGGHLYVLNERGQTTVIRTSGERLDIVACNQLDRDASHACGASPAVVGDLLILRSAAALYCIGRPDQSAVVPR
jgi:outer membrane protein assembly factor BamB